MEDNEQDSTLEVEVPENDAANQRRNDEREVRRNRHDDDDEGLSDRVKKRIGRLTHGQREAERRAEQSEYEASQLRKQLLNAHKTTTEFHGQAAGQRVDSAKAKLEAAIESGVIKEIASAQEELTDAKIDAREAARIKTRVEQDVQRVEQQPQQQQRPQVSADVEDFMERNPWFHKNPAMNAAAKAIEANLNARHRIEPGSKRSLQEIEKRIRASFPDEFEDEEIDGETDHEDGEIEVEIVPPKREQRPARPSSDSRHARNAGAQVQGNKVRLSVEQAELAKTMGLTPKAYADQFLKLRKEGKL